MVTMSLLLTLTAASTSGCSGDERQRGSSTTEAASPSPTQAEAEAEAETDAPEAPAETGAAEGDAGADAGDDDDVIEIEGPETDDDRHGIPVSAIDLHPVEVAWTERQRLADPSVELVVVATGVVARARTGVYVLDEAERLVSRPGVTVPDGGLLGRWPDDVWYAEASPIAPDADGRPRSEFQVFQLDRDLRWVAQTYKGQPRWAGDALAVRKGWYAGLLIREGSTLTRLGSRKDPPKVGLRMGKLVLDTIESSSGRLYNLSLRPNGVYVQPACFNQRCVEDQAKKFPFGSDWSFADQIPRQRNSFSIVAAVEVDHVVSTQLLHYETGGFRLETLVSAPTGLWPTVDGGLWLLVQDQLRYRSARGEWFAVPSPPGASKLSAAISADLETLWVLGRIGDEAVLFSTAGVVDAGSEGVGRRALELAIDPVERVQHSSPGLPDLDAVDPALVERDQLGDQRVTPYQQGLARLDPTAERDPGEHPDPGQAEQPPGHRPPHPAADRQILDDDRDVVAAPVVERAGVAVAREHVADARAEVLVPELVDLDGLTVGPRVGVDLRGSGDPGADPQVLGHDHDRGLVDERERGGPVELERAVVLDAHREAQAQLDAGLERAIEIGPRRLAVVDQVGLGLAEHLEAAGALGPEHPDPAGHPKCLVALDEHRVVEADRGEVVLARGHVDLQGAADLVAVAGRHEHPHQDQGPGVARHLEQGARVRRAGVDDPSLGQDSSGPLGTSSRMTMPWASVRPLRLPEPPPASLL